MKKAWETPELTIIHLIAEDAITVSTGDGLLPETGGDGTEIDGDNMW